MIVKSFSLVIAGMVVGGEAIAKHMRDSPPLSTTTTDTSPNSVTSATTSLSTTGSYFTSQWTGFPASNSPPFFPDQNIILGYIVGGDVNPTMYTEQPPSLILLYTTAQSVPDSTNTYEVLSIGNFTCNLPANLPSGLLPSQIPSPGCSFVPGTFGNATLNVEVNESQVPPGVETLGGFFLCFAVAIDRFAHSSICESYSNFFSIEVSDSSAAGSRGMTLRAVDVVSSGLTAPTSTLEIFSTTQILTSPGTVPTSSGSLPPAGTSITAEMTISIPPSTVATSTVGPTSTATASTIASQPSKSSGLSVGAKVGIALGAVAFVLLALILGLFYLRRRHNRRTQPEHVMLTQNMHAGSRDLIAEKETSGPRASIIETPIQEYLPPSHLASSSHALSPYDDSPSAPYAGPAAAVPRRKPTAATMAAATVSRGVSDASAPLSPRSGTTRGGGGGDFEEYHDEPVYGDARHIPQIYEGSSSQAPFLSPGGMTAEELEEERRIDLAIAEAERR